MKWDLNKLGNLFIKIVSELEGKKVADKALFMTSNEGKYMNFRPPDFKKIACNYLHSSNDYKLFMTMLRSLGWIVCDTGRLTNTQFINNKTTRVITIKVCVYQLLGELVDREEAVWKWS